MSDSRLAALLFGAAFLTRLVAAMGSAIFGTDGGHYLLMADWMREGRFHDALLLTYHPGYPLLIAAVRCFLPTTEQAGEIVSVTLGAGAVVPLFFAARSVFGRPVAMLAGVLYAFSPAVVEVQSDVMTEGTYIFFFFATLGLTLRMAEAPSMARGAVLGASAAAAFMTRPEGILPIVLSVMMPLVFIVRYRAMPVRRLAGVAMTVATILLLVSPYLIWVKAQRGHWAISVRASAISGERSVGMGETAGGEDSGSSQGAYYQLYARALFRLSGILIPFYLLGLPSLRTLDRFRAGLYFSFPLGQMLGILLALRRHNFMSDRYLLAGMMLMLPVAAAGLLKVLGRLSRRPGISGRPAFGAAVILIVAVLPVVRCLRLRREECRSYPVAAQWILSQGGPRPLGMSGPVEQVAYLCGSRSYYSGSRPEEILVALDTAPIEYFVYSEKDVKNRPELISALSTIDRVGAPVEVSGPSGTLKVFIQRVMK